MTKNPSVLRTLMNYRTGSFSVGAAWALGYVFDVMPGFRPRSKLNVYYYVPGRNDSASWGGGYIELQYSINGGSWFTLGTCGYDGGVMHINAYSISRYSNKIKFNPKQTAEFSVQFRLYMKSYDGAYNVNYENNLNAISGTAPASTDANLLYQHYVHIIVEELVEE